MRDGATNEHGPSWWDVEEAWANLETKTHGQVTVSGVCTSRNRTRRARWVWKVTVERTLSGKKQKPIVTTAGFRGDAGAKTVTAALWYALNEAWHLADEQEQSAVEQAAF